MRGRSGASHKVGYVLSSLAAPYILFLSSVPVAADDIETAAQEKYRLYLSKDNMTPAQNQILAKCMVDRLTTMGKKILLLADSEKGAEIAMLAAGQNPVHDDCVSEALSEAP